MNICPICNAKNTLHKKEKNFKVSYNLQNVLAKINYYKCSSCGAELELNFEKENELVIKKATEIARSNSVSETLKQLEKDFSFVEIERSLFLPPKTLSKWKNQSKTPSAAAASLISLLGIFPWLSYVGLVNYNLKESYKIAYTAILKKLKEKPEIYNEITMVTQKNQTYNPESICIETPFNIYTENIESSTIEYAM